MLSLILFFAAGIFITYENNKKMLAKRLTTETYLVARLLDDESDYTEFNAYYNNDELRVTIISMQGEVLFESDTNADLENHLQRKEVQCALAGTPKAVNRFSETLDCEMTYYAVKDTLRDGTEIIVRLALRGSEISSYFYASLPFFCLSLLLSSVIALGLSRRLSQNVTDKITEIGDSLKSLNAGQYRPLETDGAEPECLSVYREINELNESTHEHIRREEEEHRKLTAVLDNVAQGIVALNYRGEIVFANGSALQLFGGKATDTGRGLAYLLKDEGLFHRIQACLGEEFSFEAELGARILAVAGKRVSGEEGEKELSDILIFTDVTGEKEIIRQKSEFFANASHELKTPITVMQGLSEILLSKDGLDEPSEKQITRIHKESLRMAELISDMLTLSKLERGGDEEERIEVDLTEIVREGLAELSEEIAEKELTVTLKGEGKLLAAPKKIYELAQNLLSNAVHYNRQGGWLTVAVEERERELLFTVADGGIGIEAEHIPRLCERFYRVDKSRSKKTGGTGLGLAIVKHVCALYNAELSIDSVLGEGTEVSVLFRK